MRENIQSGNQPKKDSSPGTRLRRLRESRGLSLEQIAEQTHVRIQYLKALEKEDLEALYCPAYAKSYLKAYCRAVDADEELVDIYRELIETSQVEAPKKEQSERRSVPNWILIFAGLVIIGSLALYLFKPGEEEVGTKVSESPFFSDSTAEMNDTTAVEVYEPVVFGDSLLTLRLIASETTWVRVMVDGSDKPGFIMAPGGIRIFDAREDFKVTLGNAGGVELNLNGQMIPPLGEEGQVVRDIPINWNTIDTPRS